MTFLCRKCKKIGVNNFVSEIKHVEKYPDFEKLAHIIQQGLQVQYLWLKISKRQTILVVFCRNGSVSYIIPNVTNSFTKLNPNSDS